MTARTRETRSLICLVAIVAIGFGLRVINIDNQPLWGDEALTFMIAQWPLATLFVTPNDPTPGLYYALHKLLIGPESGVVAARSISLVSGTAIIIAVYGWAKSSRIPALPAAALTALCFALVDYSQEARAYSLLVLFVSLSGWAFVRWSERRNTIALVCFGACLLLAFYTHFVAVFWIVPMIVSAFLVTRGQKGERRKLEWMLCAFVVFAVPEANRLARYPKGNFSWLDQAAPSSALNATSYVLLPFGLFENDMWQLGPLLSAAAGLLCFAGLGWLGYRHRPNLVSWTRNNRAAAMSLVVSLALPPAIWLFGYIHHPIFMPRTILISAPGFFILVSLILGFGSKLAQRAVVAVYAINLLLTGTVRTKEDWRSVSDVLASNVQKGDVILLCPGWKAFAFRHALDHQLEAPLLLETNGRMMQIEQSVGHDPNWVNSYFVALTKKKGINEGQYAMSNAKRAWRISSGCGEI